MGAFIDITGQRYGRLVVTNRAKDYVSPKGYVAVNWECRCDCGNTTIVRGCNLKRGATISCGCVVEEHPNHTTHGQSKTRLYNIWRGIISRCTNPSCCEGYADRGISVCKEWLESYETFRKWSIENGYNDSLSIDRIDVNGNYEPHNCRWADVETQQNNKRNNHYLVFNGETKTISQWAKEVGIPAQRIKDRINKCGWSVEKALTTPKMKNQFC